MTYIRRYTHNRPFSMFLFCMAALLLIAACYEDAPLPQSNQPLAKIQDETTPEAETPRTFRFAVITDPHVCDDYYDGQEGNQLDTDTVAVTDERLKAVRDAINALDPQPEAVFVPGDIIHNYPNDSAEFVRNNRTRFDIAKEIFDGFDMPVHITLGNHDYDVKNITRETTHELFKEKFGVDPYYSVDLHGFRFILLNNFLGETWDADSDNFQTDLGSLGETQLNWLNDQLAEGMPSFLFMHYMLPLVIPTEGEDLGLQRLLRQYKDDIRLFFAGHTHRWINFGDMYGPQHMVLGATRYDPDNYLIVEVDTASKTFRILNSKDLHWGTAYAEPYAE